MSDYCEYGTVVKIMFRISVSETYDIQDCLIWDTSSNANISEYTASKAFTYDSTEQAYYISTSSSMSIVRGNFDNTDYEAEVDIKLNSSASSTGSVYYGISNQILKPNDKTDYCATKFDTAFGTFYRLHDSGNSNSSSQSYSTNVWYTIRATKSGTTLLAELISNGSVIATKSVSISNPTETMQLLMFITKGNFYFKNLKLKPL